VLDGLSASIHIVGLQRLDIRCLLALRPMLDLEGHPLAFLQRFEAFFLNFREVRKEVLAAVV